MECEVIYAPSPDEQIVKSLKVKEGMSVRDAIRRSGIIFPQESTMGIFGQKIDPDTTIVKEGDRIEIYRPLLIDPKLERLFRVPPKQRLMREVKSR